MLNQLQTLDPVVLYRAATARALAVADAVDDTQLGAPTPCSEWTVQLLIDHLVGGTEYLLAAVDGRQPNPPTGTTPADYRRGVAQVLEALLRPAALQRTCVSPLGFEWTVSQAVAGTFMDVLIHTWDLARATGQDERLDADLVEACTAMFLPDMPKRGREAGIIGPEVTVDAHASPQDRLLAALGRRP
jgi:uncharacterized protein (TIGR03086 family)